MKLGTQKERGNGNEMGNGWVMEKVIERKWKK